MNADEFNAMTDTGKFRVVTEQEARAAKAENSLAALKRLVAGLARIVFEPDEIIEIAMGWAEKDGKQNQTMVK